MRRHITSFSLVLCGLCLIFGGLTSLTSAPVASAMPGLAPSPRPPVDRPPDDSPPDEPSTGSPDADDDDDSRSSANQPAATGRVTGTIIDAATGAPMPGITVDVGGATVTSDANGNYDHWLPVGRYRVGLMLTSGQGADLQGPQTVDVRAGDTTVRHLYFRSQVAPTATPAPVATATAVRSAAPVDSLPNTGIIHSDGASDKPAQLVSPPQHLPHTSIPTDSSWLWLTLGISLVLFGTLVGWSARPTTSRSITAPAAAPRSDDSDALLATLLTESLGHSTDTDDTLLAELLNVERRV